MHRIVAVLVLLVATPAAAQVQSRPTDPPLVTAENDSWYRLGEPVQFAGELYYPAGARVFFNGNTMVRTGHYNGVPLYADTTVEPFSIVLVPIGRGLMQPYERLRRGDVAGTTASRAPSFPVRATAEMTRPPSAAVSPTAPPLPTGAISAFTAGAVGTTGTVARSNCPPAVMSTMSTRAPEVVGTAGFTPRSRVQTVRPIVTLRRPESNDGVWVQFRGERWVSAGPAVRVSGSDFVRIGEYAGFPVFARGSVGGDVIYLPTGAGLFAPYRVKR